MKATKHMDTKSRERRTDLNNFGKESLLLESANHIIEKAMMSTSIDGKMPLST